MTRRAWFQVHSFAGVVLGLLLFVICWSGSFATLSHELDWLVTPAARVPAGGERASWGTILAAVQAAYPGARVTRLEAPLYSRSAAEALIRLPDGQPSRIYLDPYSGEVRGASSLLTVWRFFRSFHRSLFLPVAWGVPLVSLFGLLLLVLLVSSLCFHKRWWRGFFRFRRGGRRMLWSELHRLAGLWSLGFLLVMGLTGSWYGIEKLRAGLGDGITVYAGAPGRSVVTLVKPDGAGAGPPLPLDALVREARRLRPELSIRTLRFEPGVLYLDGQAGSLLLRDRANQLRLDRHSGRLLYDQRGEALPAYWRWVDTADPLHFGSFAGLAGKLLWFCFGLSLSGLCLTGVWLHAERVVRLQGRGRWPGTLAAAAVSLALVAASLPLGLQELRSAYGAPVEGVRQLPAVAPGVACVILGWIGVSLLLLAFWAALLWRSIPRAPLPRLERLLP
ncbi:Uncharacterized iron-regulated membrane protein [Tistlia consotensis]|uniref:Uncharacterized iron-regulated membrane protein n=1 Tax=Tistlia consotensis USBA 355 TaxID=560819 RepID=A0A1Y6CDM3_9PROT|nr:PepSY-associated TM helix domain-containing protein [Tistlia consotensis]SMF55843.1 Uncharacterized iron-regulated membrane protein [Tistlia consotensis USBA 355]SNR89417.1 Uncharacterized iron-regulated membrane protein [Tistlia consotensis]